MAEKKAGRDGKLLGYDPETGLVVTLRTVRFGPYVQLGEGTNEEKPKRTDIPRGVNANTIELQYALKLLSLPREVGLHPETGKPVTAGLNYFRHNGPFIEHEGTYVDLPGVEEVFEIGINRAVALLAEKGKRLDAAPTVLMDLGEHPEQGGKVQVLSGHRGPYVKHGDINATLPRGQDPAALTLEEAVSLIADTPSPGPRREGEMIREIREKAGLTADELGKRVGASSMTVRRWEDGMLLSIKDVKRIARALGCSSEDIPGFDLEREETIETTEEQNTVASTWSWTGTY